MKLCKVAVTRCLKQVLPNKITGDGIKKPEHIIVQGYNLCIQSQDCIEGEKKKTQLHQCAAAETYWK